VRAKVRVAPSNQETTKGKSFGERRRAFSQKGCPRLMIARAKEFRRALICFKNSSPARGLWRATAHTNRPLQKAHGGQRFARARC
jgi:hypothetical protein